MRKVSLFLLPVLCVAVAAQAQQKTFDSPDDAAKALIAAAADNNTAALNAIFGPKGASILTSGDAAQDKAEREEFVSIARQKYQLEPDSMNRDRVILSIGEDDWPFPVPIVKTNGKWSFDTAMGSTMMQARRIGADELDAIEVCTGYATAEVEYAQQHGGAQYAQRMVSLAGKDDGLYSAAHPLVPREFAESAADGISNLRPKRYHGYYFKVLTGQGPDAPGGRHNYLVKDSLMGGFALVAWPADYGVTGIHTFIVNQDGVVYESNLGHPANALAAPVERFNPDPSWKPLN
ncbi:MAG TPA: DUF2950 family protein [Bryobacteraceae bacterium]|nr:DUF2950 family protein [Bryobacteraceae bacterium]